MPLRNKIDALQHTLLDNFCYLCLYLGKRILTIKRHPIIKPQDIGNTIVIAEKTKWPDRLIIFEIIMNAGHVFCESSHIELMTNRKHVQHGGFLFFLPL
ncbi:hypothetical protein K931_04472 [Aeromonas salmonicida subsp. pectinolytica 34mel]|nr:hypothetical protein K931_04472 [Aeromonas salmonicida subsp. pectinolytica 34mel]